MKLFAPISCKIVKPSSLPNGIAMKFSNYYLQLGAKQHPRSMLVFDLVEVVGHQNMNLDLFAMIAQAIWQRRNKLHVNETCTSPFKILESAATLLTDFQKRKAPHIPRPLPILMKWKPHVLHEEGCAWVGLGRIEEFF